MTTQEMHSPVINVAAPEANPRNEALMAEVESAIAKWMAERKVTLISQKRHRLVNTLYNHFHSQKSQSSSVLRNDTDLPAQ